MNDLGSLMRMLAETEAFAAMLRRQMGERRTAAAPEDRSPPPPLDASVSDWITTEAAAIIAGRDSDTIVLWCKKFGCGEKMGGRWRVSYKGLRQVMSRS